MSSKPQRKPDWLKVRFPAGPAYARIDRYHKQQGLHSVCRSAACPNQGECWSRGTATFMILGNLCTRTCRFCNVADGTPLPPDPQEPARIAEAVAELGLQYAVITSVTRDDLLDGGASHFAAQVEAIRAVAPDCRIELLIPDLKGDRTALETIVASSPDVLGHNLETVPRLYPRARQGAVYSRSLKLLDDVRAVAPAIPTKSGLMLGLGESEEEVLETMEDLLEVGCRLLTLGQYLQPSRSHLPVSRYVPPEDFDRLARKGKALGFAHVEAGPLVRSSYQADRQFAEAESD
ncbi:MAG: lipoyl synthase [Desulfuromonadales bacterium]|nr:lipoyl synthase [Desulfuromonadales bacterium]NIR33861.1 lipoyl synthase [Desulfuromonadales bacterium]NIS40012.1 lipoyl synthase [Desulfuromonadales bacterium]